MSSPDAARSTVMHFQRYMFNRSPCSASADGGTGITSAVAVHRGDANGRDVCGCGHEEVDESGQRWTEVDEVALKMDAQM